MWSPTSSCAHARADQPTTEMSTLRRHRRRRPVLAPVLLLGVGLGGFLDGIVLHQVLQWHHVLTATGDHPADSVRGLEQNTLADGRFHVASWLFVVVGTTLVVRAWQQGGLAPPWRLHAGMLLAGWGAFNVVEGVVNHHLLTLHHVRDDIADSTLWDVGFLCFGAMLVVAGAWLARSSAKADDSPVDSARPPLVD
jgi:uncharacterized membrane protein